jgi:Ca-activated chloride channel family protein
MGRTGGTGRTGRAASIAAALVLLFHAALPAHPGLPALPSQDPPSFRSTSSELVVLPVVVTDKQNRYVSDLAREHFVVFDNGRKVSVEFFTNEDAPATIGLIVDASGSMKKKLGEVLTGALAFAKTSNPQDELFALRFNDDVRSAVAGRRFLLADDLVALEQAIGSMLAE